MYVDQIEGFLKNQITLASSPAPVLAYEESGLPGTLVAFDIHRRGTELTSLRSLGIHSLDTSGSPAPDLARGASMETGSSASKVAARVEEEDEGKDEDDESEDEVRLEAQVQGSSSSLIPFQDPSSPFRLSEDDRTLAGLAQLLNENKCQFAGLYCLAHFSLTPFSPVKNICVLAGAGISTSAGIPDFRSPETGLCESSWVLLSYGPS